MFSCYKLPIEVDSNGMLTQHACATHSTNAAQEAYALILITKLPSIISGLKLHAAPTGWAQDADVQSQ